MDLSCNFNPFTTLHPPTNTDRILTLAGRRFARSSSKYNRPGPILADFFDPVTHYRKGENSRMPSFLFGS